MPSFRDRCPERTFTGSYSSHRRYKAHLRVDFKKKCGYCDDLDLINGGHRSYQVDHFVPMHPVNCVVTIASNEYSNLVYSCAFCNRAKWNKWPTNDETLHNDGLTGFVDPCTPEYHSHLERSTTGEINPLTDLGKYMHAEIRLYLKRHAIIYNIEKLSNNIKEIKNSLVGIENQELKEKLNGLLLEHSNFFG